MKHYYIEIIVSIPHPHRIAGSSFRLLSNIPHCCLIKAGLCCSPSVTVRPLRPAKRNRFGLPLPDPSFSVTRIPFGNANSLIFIKN